MSERDTPYEVIVVDDHPVVRSGLTALLSASGLVVTGEAEDGPGAVRLTILQQPDVVVMDLSMPGGSGIEATRVIARQAPRTAVLVLSMSSDDASVFAALRAGARGYVLKGSDPASLVRAVESVAAGDAVFGPGLAEQVLAYFSSPPSTAEPIFPRSSPSANARSSDSSLPVPTTTLSPLSWESAGRPSVTTCPTS